MCDPSPPRRAKWSTLDRPPRVGQGLIRGLLAVAVIVAWLLLLRFDVPIMRWGSGVFPDDPRGWTEQFLLGLRDFGQILPVIVTCVIVGALDPRRRRIIAAILLAQLLAMLVYNGGKYTIVRYRPNASVVDVLDPAARSADSWGGWKPLNTEDCGQSFPSGHSAAAFAFGTVLAAFYPRLAWLFWTLAVGCAASRFVQFFHWPSDCLAGAVLGYLCARLWVWVFLRPNDSRAAQPVPASGSVS